MKAAVVYANEDVRYQDYPTPEPKDSEVRIAVKAAGICGSDVPRVLYNGVHFYPIVLGHEFSGEIDKVGSGVNGFQKGDRVTAAPLVPCHNCGDCVAGNFSLCKNYTFIGSRIQGAFADFVCVPAVNAVKFDKSVSFGQGAFFEPSTVALHGIYCNNYRKGGKVAVLGGGTIGLFTMQWAKLLGAESVAVFDISEERLELAKELGADYIVNTLKDGFKDEAMPYTSGGGYNYVFEAAGIDVTMKLAFEIAANKANVCFIGTPSKDLVFSPKLWENMNRKELKLTGSWMSYSSPYPGKEWSETARCFSDGTLKFNEKLIFKKLPMSGAQTAFMMFKDPAGVKGKILLVNE